MEMRKHWSDYFKGYPNFKVFRIRIMQMIHYSELLSILDEVENYYHGYIPEKQLLNDPQERDRGEVCHL